MTDRTRRSLWVVSGLLMFAVVVLAAYDFSVISSARADPPAQVQAQAEGQEPSLGLRAERSGEEWKLAWNPDAPALRKSPEAELLIEDGPHRTQLLLTPDQIGKGSVQYAAFTDSVVFHMKAFDRNHKSSTEILRVVQSGTPAEGGAERAVPARAWAAGPLRTAAPGTMIVHGTLLRGTPIDVRIPVDSQGRPAESATMTDTAPRRGGILHKLSNVGKAPARLWPFHHRREPDRPN